MDTKDIRTSSEPDWAGSYYAIQRAVRSAEEFAIKTNTSIVVCMDGKNVCLSASELIKLRKKKQLINKNLDI
jgi:hypothetical protein